MRDHEIDDMKTILAEAAGALNSISQWFRRESMEQPADEALRMAQRCGAAAGIKLPPSVHDVEAGNA